MTGAPRHSGAGRAGHSDLLLAWVIQILGIWAQIEVIGGEPRLVRSRQSPWWISCASASIS